MTDSKVKCNTHSFQWMRMEFWGEFNSSSVQTAKGDLAPKPFLGRLLI